MPYRFYLNIMYYLIDYMNDNLSHSNCESRHDNRRHLSFAIQVS
jgi:hypothetical protein